MELIGQSQDESWIAAILGEALIGGRFADLAVLGDPKRGNFSYVFQGVDTQTGRTIVLKFLRPERMNQAPWASYFKREGEVSMALKGHQNFVQLVAPPGIQPVVMTLSNGAQVSFPLQYLATERAVRDFDVYLYRARSHPGALWRRLSIIRDIVKAVAKLHRLGYSHRDLKPDNIFLFPNGNARLGDLGMCRKLNEADHLQSNYDQPVGARLYAAPETFCGAGNHPILSARADWFAVGAILFESVTGVRLYAAIGLQQPLEVVLVFAQHGPLDRFERMVEDIAGAYPIPALEDYTPRALAARSSSSTLANIDSLIRNMCHFDHRRRLCNFERILQRLDLAIAQARFDERQWAQKQATHRSLVMSHA